MTISRPIINRYFETKRTFHRLPVKFTVLCFVLIAFAVTLYILSNENIRFHYPSFSLLAVFKNYRHHPILIRSSHDACQWIFDHYSPSLWETYWYNNISILKNHTCSTLKESDQFNKSIATLEYIINAQKAVSKGSFSSEKYDKLLSKMYYRYTCSGSSQFIVSQYIEPLIGLLRDPLTICTPLPIPPSLVIEGDSLQSKRFFLLGPSAPYQDFTFPITSIVPWLHLPGAQKILFDLGSSYFNGMSDTETTSTALGTRWFYEYFRSNSLSFDRIVAFETSQYTPEKYWNQIPEDIIGKFTFINTGVQITGKYNPWNILKSAAKPEDYVIIKLDIDTPTIESELMKQVVNDSSIYTLIDEMFFEMHVTVDEMKDFWGTPAGDLEDTYKLFRKLRELGIRMHSWP